MFREDLHGDVGPRQVVAETSIRVVFQKEQIATCFGEILALLDEHYEEVAEFKSLLRLDPDYERYRDMEKRDGVHIMTARENGILIGYVIYFVYRHIHYKSVLTAADDIHFIRKDRRKGSVGVRLLLEGEKMLLNLGVKLILLRCKVRLNHAPIFERLGYRPFDIMYAKEIGAE